MIVGLAGVFAGCGSRDEPAARNVPGPSPKRTDAQTAQPARPAETAAAEPAQGLERGRTLYAQHCAGCHGENGNGQAVAARFLFPRPRDFRSGRFRLVSTTNGIPTSEDIQNVLTRGMPGSAMPPWPGLNDDDRRLLAEQVIEFRREGIRDAERQIALDAGEEVDEDELEELVRDLTVPGPPVAVPSLGGATPEAIDRGRQLYLTRGCASCHGQDGRGDGQAQMVDAEGLPARPRDLTRGIFKGNPDPVSIYRRILAGMPGSPMPASQQITPEQVSDLVHFVLSLSDEETRQRTVLNRERITAVRLAQIDEAPDGAAWNDVSPVHIRLVPLWWRNEFTPTVAVQAAHDGTTIALRLSWADAQGDFHASRSEAFEDAIAVSLSRDEPFLGMGMTNAPVDLWFWDADRQHGLHDIEEEHPRLAVDIYPLSESVAASPEYGRPGTEASDMPDLLLPARATGNQIVPRADAPAASALEVGGPGSVTFRPPVSQLVEARGAWNEGQWAVVMTHPLDAGAGGGLTLKAGESVSVALAVWDGSQRDRNGQKLISIWQELVLDK
jgi:mono/diheme cytochrome c family protein